MNDETTEGAGWVLFAGIMLMILSILNIIWGIAAIDKASFFVANTHFIISDLSTWGWVVLIIGGLQLIAAFSIWAGGQYGRWVGMITAGVGSIAALMSLPANSGWGLAVFAVDVLIIYGLAAYGGQRTAS